MATKKKMKYQVKKGYLGKVRLEDGHGSTTLDEKTSQDALAKFYESGAGTGFIEPVAESSAAQTQGNAKVGQ